MTYDADLLVAGGGPAGLAAAWHARQAGMSVIVAEPRTAPIDKACGEGLMPGGVAMLRGIGAEPPGMPFAGIAYCAADGRQVRARFSSGTGLGVRRTALDAALQAAAIGAGAQLTPVRIVQVSQDATGVSAFDSASAALRARWMIAADGLHSAVRRALGIAVRSGSPRRYGLRCHWRTPVWSDFVEVWWSDLGEAYVTPVAPGLVGVAVLHHGRGRGYAELLQGFPELAARLAGAEPTGPVLGAGPLRQVVRRRVCGRVLLAGDAAGYEDALTGEGISLALHQAEAAVGALAAGDPGRYERQWRRITRSYRLLTRGLVLATARRPVRRLIVPVAAAAPWAFRAVVNQLAR